MAPIKRYITILKLIKEFEEDSTKVVTQVFDSFDDFLPVPEKSTVTFIFTTVNNTKPPVISFVNDYKQKEVGDFQLNAVIQSQAQTDICTFRPYTLSSCYSVNKNNLVLLK